jgi:hypothetical protein
MYTTGANQSALNYFSDFFSLRTISPGKDALGSRKMSFGKLSRRQPEYDGRPRDGSFRELQERSKNLMVEIYRDLTDLRK